MATDKYNFDGTYRLRVVTRATPKRSLGGTAKDCWIESQDFFACFSPIAALSYLDTFALVFGKGKCSAMSLKSLGANVVHECAKKPGYKEMYRLHSTNRAAQFLTDYQTDGWNFHLGTICESPVANLFQNEATNVVRLFLLEIFLSNSLNRL